MEPSQIGSYRVDETIAIGGMGIVYLAWDDVLSRKVVIKTFRRDLPMPAELRERLIREGKAHGRLQHVNIAAIYAMDQQDHELYIVMEQLDGKTLDAMLTALPEGRMTLDDALPLFEQVLDALDSVHAHGIVHRELKPSYVTVSH